MLFAGVAEAGFAVVYLSVRPGIVKRLLRVAMVLLAIYMIAVPLAPGRDPEGPDPASLPSYRSARVARPSC